MAFLGFLHLKEEPTILQTNEDGQSTIEFLVSLTLAFGFIFSFMKIAIVYTNGYLVHYVVFQASRAYMVGEVNSNNKDGSDANAKAMANSVFASYKLEDMINEFSSSLIFEEPLAHTTNDTNLFIGPRLNFNSSILIPGTAAKIEFELSSESYLGMEPTRAECFSRMCAAMSGLGSGSGCFEHATVSDNGC